MRVQTRFNWMWVARTATAALLVLPAIAGAVNCKDEAKKQLTYLAITATNNSNITEYSEAAIEDYRYVIDNAQNRLDRRAAYLSCRQITGMLYHADLLDEKQDLLEGCDDSAVNSFLNSLMPESTSATDDESKASTAGGVAPGDYLPIVRVAPVYPQKLLRDGTVGVVIVELSIAENGKPDDVKAIVSSNKKFENAAEQAVQKFRYKPRVIDGKAVVTTGVVTALQFSLVGNNDLFTTYPECEAE